MQKIDEITSPPMLATEHGVNEAAPEAVSVGQYPEFEYVELPEHLKPKGPFQSGRVDFAE